MGVVRIFIIAKNTPTTVTGYWPSKHGLGVGHLNTRHLSNKITEVSNILYIDNIPFHILGFSVIFMITIFHCPDTLLYEEIDKKHMKLAY